MVSRARKVKLMKPLAEGEVAKGKVLAAVELDKAPYFRALLTPFRGESEDTGSISDEVQKDLGVAEGGEAWVLPLE